MDPTVESEDLLSCPRVSLPPCPADPLWRSDLPIALNVSTNDILLDFDSNATGTCPRLLLTGRSPELEVEKLLKCPFFSLPAALRLSSNELDLRMYPGLLPRSPGCGSPIAPERVK